MIHSFSLFKDLQKHMTVGEYRELMRDPDMPYFLENYLSGEARVNEIAWRIVNKIHPSKDFAEAILVKHFFRPPHWTKLVDCSRCGWMPHPTGKGSCRWCHYITELLGEEELSVLGRSAGGFKEDSSLPRFLN